MIILYSLSIHSLLLLLQDALKEQSLHQPYILELRRYLPFPSSPSCSLRTESMNPLSCRLMACPCFMSGSTSISSETLGISLIVSRSIAAPSGSGMPTVEGIRTAVQGISSDKHAEIKPHNITRFNVAKVEAISFFSCIGQAFELVRAQEAAC